MQSFIKTQFFFSSTSHRMRSYTFTTADVFEGRSQNLVIITLHVRMLKHKRKEVMHTVWDS